MEKQEETNMPKYLLLLRGWAERPKDLSPDEIQAIIERYNTWYEKLKEAGHFVGAERLSNSGRVLRGSGARMVIRDGPYVESKEVIGGFFLIEAKNYEQAVELARECPRLDMERGAVEVREIVST